MNPTIFLQVGVNDLPTPERIREIQRERQAFAETLGRYWRQRFLRTGRWRSRRLEDEEWCRNLESAMGR